MDMLVKLQHFFSVDMKIKKEIYNICPPREYIDDETMMKYVDNTYESLIYIFNELKEVTLDFLGEKSVLYSNIVDMEKYIKSSFINAGISVDKLNDLYKNFISNMNENFVDKVKEECFGYRASNESEAQGIATSVNEILHYLHSYVLNNDIILQSVPQISNKTNSYGIPISYRGVSNDYFNQLYNSFPTDLYVGNTDVISLSENKLLMMIRDRGHALSIEITINGNVARMEYFIPTLFNIDIVNSLPGINKVDKDKASINNVGATGVVEVDKSQLSNILYDFIGRVPMDESMNMYANKMR